MLLRKDGFVKVYAIQHKWPGKDKWELSIANEWKFSAAKDCWQQTGLHATYDKEEAKEALVDVEANDVHDREFRVVEINIFQLVSPI